jgi:hypothetical protein
MPELGEFRNSLRRVAMAIVRNRRPHCFRIGGNTARVRIVLCVRLPGGSGSVGRLAALSYFPLCIVGGTIDH